MDLLYYAYQGNMKAFEKAIKEGANVNQVNKQGETSLDNAVANGHLSIGGNDLHYYAYQGNIKEFEKAIKEGANVNQVNKLGETPLDNAVANGHLSMVRKIIKLGGNVKEKRLLNTAFFSGSVPMIKEIMKYQKFKNPNTRIHSAVQSNNLNLLKFLFSLGANVNFKNKQGETPLLVALKLVAIQSGHINKTRRLILKELLKRGADINMVDKKGQSPIDIAQKYANVVKFLKKHSK